MEADHSSICKFDNPKGPDYKQVIGNLQELVEGAINTVKERERRLNLRVPVASVSLAKPCEYIDNRISLNCMNNSPLTSRFHNLVICPYLENPNFVGRASILEEIKQRLRLGNFEEITHAAKSNNEHVSVARYDLEREVEHIRKKLNRNSLVERVVALWGLGGVGYVVFPANF